MYVTLLFVAFSVKAHENSYYRSIKIDNKSALEVSVWIEAVDSMRSFHTIVEPHNYIVRRSLYESNSIDCSITQDGLVESKITYQLDPGKEKHTIVITSDGQVLLFSQDLDI